MTSPLAIGIVGLNFGRWIIEELQRPPARDYFRIGAVCDLDAEKARSFAEKLKVKACTDLDQLLADPGIPVVGLYTGPARRADLLRKIIRAGKDVMTTKPFELEPAAARAVLEEAAALGRVIFLNSPPPRPAKWMEQVLAWHQEFDLGRPISAHCEAMAHYVEKADGSWYDDAERCPVAPIFRIGVYLINDLVRLFGGVERVQALGSRVLTGRPTLDNANLNMLFKNGAVGSVHANFCVDDGQYYSNSFVLHYERGTIHRNLRFMPYGQANLGSRLQLVAVTGEKQSTTRELELFDNCSDYQWDVLYDTVTRREVTPAPIDDIVHGVEVLAAMKRAEKSGRLEAV
jgi:predicted dehydrogenase